MNKEFLGDKFLLTTDIAWALFNDYAKTAPLVDYHCHLNPKEIAEDKTFTGIAEAWLGADHYKWRIMRACGIPERLITGDASDESKFYAFATALPRAIGNPVYQWAHLELKRYFGINKTLCKDTAKEIMVVCDEKLRNGLTPRKMIELSNVAVLITTDDPVDTLEWHDKIAKKNGFKTQVYPGWRPDKAITIGEPEFGSYIKTLSEAADIEINSLASLKDALINRMDHFSKFGCCAADHGLTKILYAPASESELEFILQKRLSGNYIDTYKENQFTFEMMKFLGEEYARRDWVMEIHVGAARGVNSVMNIKLGSNTGYDCIDANNSLEGITKLLDSLALNDVLPKTILFSLEPSVNAALCSIAGCFQGEGINGKVQQGAAWWFNDTKKGMIDQLTTFADKGVLGSFIGMLTDSRSFLSYPRHEYFRRLLCGMIGEWVEAGEYPYEMKTLGGIVRDICCDNALRFFKIHTA